MSIRLSENNCIAIGRGASRFRVGEDNHILIGQPLPLRQPRPLPLPGEEDPDNILPPLPPPPTQAQIDRHRLHSQFLTLMNLYLKRQADHGVDYMTEVLLCHEWTRRL